MLIAGEKDFRFFLGSMDAPVVLKGAVRRRDSRIHLQEFIRPVDVRKDSQEAGEWNCLADPSRNW
jgi:hypothetical protein